MCFLSQDIEIAIRDGAEVLESSQCRTLLLPDGRLGAFWRGLVYPIGNGGIDVASEAFPPAVCQAAGTVPDRPPYDFIEGDAEAYLLLAGPVAGRESAAATLRSAGVTVLRSGRYLGEPVDGFVADWFVRFVKPPDTRQLEILLGRLFGPRSPQAEVAETAAQTRLRLLQDELTQARQREAVLREALARAHAEQAPPPVALGKEHLHDELAQERQLRIEAEAARVTAEAALDALRHEASRSVPPGSRNRLQEEVTAVLEAMLPSLMLLRDSLTVAVSEYASRKALYRALAELVAAEGRLPPQWKAVQGATSWWERHVSNGQDNTGRLYARFIPATRGWEALISDKGEQPHDMIWLRRHAPA